MRCLIIAPEIEDPQYRGIQMIMKHLIKSAASSDLEVSLLSGHISDKSGNLIPNLKKQVELIYLKHYLTKGYESLRLISKKFSPLSVGLAFLKNFFRKPKIIPIPHNSEYQDIPLLNSITNVIDVPYIYQFLIKGFPRIASYFIQKVVDQNKIDIVITSGPLSIRKFKNNYKLVQFIHDFIPLVLTEDPMENGDIIRFAKKVNSAILYSDLLLTNSESTKSQILEIDSSKKVAVLNGAYSAFSDELKSYDRDSAVLESTKLEKGKYFLYVSSLEKRKNVMRIAKAFVSVAHMVPFSLVMAGKCGYKHEELVAYLATLPKELNKRIILPGHITEHDKYTLMKNAFAFVYPSLFEGFGIPVLEALGHGCPTITTRVGGIPEIAQQSVYYVDNPYSESEIAQGMINLYSDTHLYARLRKEGPERAFHFSEHSFKEKFASAINQLNLT